MSFPDLLWYHNNGVFALQPHFLGRFGRFVQRRETTGADSNRVWAFGTPGVYQAEGRWMANAADLRAFHGNLHAWKELTDWMDSPRVGITRERTPIHVPFSNGPVGDDYAAWEYDLRRDDNPQMALNAFLTVLANEAQDEAERDDPERRAPAVHWGYAADGRIVER